VTSRQGSGHEAGSGAGQVFGAVEWERELHDCTVAQFKSKAEHLSFHTAPMR